MTAPRLSARIESFRYPDGTVALSAIHLDVMAGEFCGILGSNGSGKTTLLKVLDGMIKDSNGTVLLDGDDIRRLSPRQIYGKVGLVFQNPDDQLFAHSVYEDVAFGPRNMGLGEDEVRLRVAEALEAVEISDLSTKDIHNLSYGQKKRACIAGLLAIVPAAFAAPPGLAGSGVATVPADAAFFFASLRIREQVDRFLASNACIRLRWLATIIGLRPAR